MTQSKVMNGDLHIIFSEKNDDDVVVVEKLDNGAELEFVDDNLVTLILPNFEAQLGRGPLSGLEINLKNVHMDNDTILFNIDVEGQSINGKVDCSSIK